MNSSVLVTGFVGLGVAVGAVFFVPALSSNSDAPPTYDVQPPAASVEDVDIATSVADASTNIATSETVEGDSAASADFVWETPANDSAATPNSKKVEAKVVEAKVVDAKSDADAQTKQHSPASAVSKRVGASTANASKSGSTAASDLEDFFGKSPTRKNSPATTSKGTSTTAPVARVAEVEPVLATTRPKRKKRPNPFGGNSADTVSDAKAKTTTEAKTTMPTEPAFADATPVELDAPSLSRPSLGAPERSTEVAKSSKPVKASEPVKVAKREETLVVGKASEAKPDSNGDQISGSLQPVAKATDADQIRITNPMKTGLPVTFIIHTQQITLQPGQAYVIQRKDSDAPIKFSRGGTFGYTNRELPAGKYRFSVTRERGWKLQ